MATNCGGCECKVPIEVAPPNRFPFDNDGAGGFERDPLNDPRFSGELGIASYSTSEIQLIVTPTAGTCDSACVQTTSCAFDVTVVLTVSLGTDDPNDNGPLFDFTAPAGSTGGGTMNRVGATVIYDPVSDTYGREIYHTLEITVEPGCGSTTTLTIADTDFVVNPAGGAWTKVAGEGDEDTVVEFECEPCDGTKRVTSDQSTGKNSNRNSIDKLEALE